MTLLFENIPLDKISVSMTMNGAVLPIMAFYILAAEEQGVNLQDLSGTIQNDILKEFMVRNTYIYPPTKSMKIVSDIIEYTTKKMPKYNSISISGYHMHEAGATPEIELAYTLADGLEYIRTGLRAGLNIDDFAPRLSFFWGIGMDHYKEIAKLRAARILWSKIVKQFNPKNSNSLRLRTHCQTSGWSLTAQAPFNNVARTTIEAMSAIFGGTQSLHTNALDEALSLPTDFSARIARNTQIYLQDETQITNTVDPWAGSYHVETLTEDMAKNAWKLIQEIENLGGMTKALEMGIPKLKIEEAALKKQARIDGNQDLIIGMNAFKQKNTRGIDSLEVDNSFVRKTQIERLQKLKKYRNKQRVQQSLLELTNCAISGKGNLLEFAINAGRHQATLGEISLALEKKFDRYEAIPNVLKGIYHKEISDDPNYQSASALVTEYRNSQGEPPKIFLSKLGQDGHDRGLKIIASSFADLGFEVHLGTLFKTPKEVVQEALQKNVALIGLSSLAAGHKTLIPEIIKELKLFNREDILIIVGGILPRKDQLILLERGVSCIFGPGTKISQAAKEILLKLIQKKDRL
jgi:methylmalonyl-CoA mutase